MDAYCGHELTHQRLEAHREIFSRATAAARWSWPSVGGESGLCGGHSVVAAFGCTLARHAGAVSQRRDLLAALAALAGAGGLGKSLAATAAPTGPAGTPRLGRGLSGRHVPAGQNRGEAVGQTLRGKGMKLVLIVERHGTPLGVYGTSAQPSEHRGAEPARTTIRVPVPVAGVRAANHVAWSRIGATTATRCGCDSVVAAST